MYGTPAELGGAASTVRPSDGAISRAVLSALIVASRASSGVLFCSLRWQRETLRAPHLTASVTKSAQASLDRCPRLLRMRRFRKSGYGPSKRENRSWFDSIKRHSASTSLLWIWGVI